MRRKEKAGKINAVKPSTILDTFICPKFWGPTANHGAFVPGRELETCKLPTTWSYPKTYESVTKRLFRVNFTPRQEESCEVFNFLGQIS